MSNKKEQLSADDYAEAFERDMPPKVRWAFGELRAAMRVLANAARAFTLIEGEYIEAKKKAAKKGKK